jgi:putative RNA 2'-phosphotransferase
MPDHDRISRRLAFLLRHRPDAGHLTLGAGGWAPVDGVLAALAIERTTLETIVQAGGKRRFEIDPARDVIRALHGHSVAVEIDHERSIPPETLFHGTVASRLRSIRREGLVAGKRTHVHLSSTADEAREVGRRRGAPVVIEVRAAALARERDIAFSLVPGSTVWLVPAVHPDYLVIPDVG